MDELRKLLKEGKLSFKQNFIVAFELFKDMLKNDNKEIIVLFTLYLSGTILTVLNPTLRMLAGIVSIIAVTRMWLLYKKVIFKIEEREYDNNGNLIKVIALLGFSALIGLLMIIMFMHYIFSLGLERIARLEQLDLLSELKVPIIILIVVFIVIQLCILYLIPIYMSRKGGFWESFKYNMYLSKGNVIRMFVPLVIIGVVNLGTGQALSALGAVGLFLATIISTAVAIYKVILVSIIYLNVEYTSDIPEEFSYMNGREEETSEMIEDKIGE